MLIVVSWSVVCLNVACGLIWFRSAKFSVFTAVVYHFPQPGLFGFGFGVSLGGFLKWIMCWFLFCSG